MTPKFPRSNSEGLNNNYSSAVKNGHNSHQSVSVAPPPPPPNLSPLQQGAVPDEFKTFTAKSVGDMAVPKASGATLRVQLLRMFLPLTLGPLAIASFVGYRVVDGFAQDSAREHLAEVALVGGDATLQFVEDSQKIPLSVATNPLIINAARANAQRAAEEGLTQLSIDALEQQFSATRSLPVDTVLNGYMNTVVENEGIDKLHVTQRDGYVFTFNVPTGDFVQSDEDWWQNAQANVQWIEPPEIDPSTGAFSVDFSQAVLDPASGEFLGVVQAVIAAESFNETVIELLEGLVLRGSEQVQVVEANSGLVIGTVTADGSVETADITGGEAIQQAIVALSAASESQGGNVQQALDGVQAEHPLRQVVISTDDTTVGGQNLIAAFTYQGKRYVLVAIPNANWVSVASVDLADIQAAGRNLALILFLIALPLAGASVFLVLLLAKQLSDPLKGLSGTAEQVSMGDLTVVAQPKGTSETQTLAQTFNTLIARVRTFLNEQQANTEKAQALAEVASAPARSLPELFESFSDPLAKMRALLGVDRLFIFQFTGQDQGQVIFEAAGQGWFGDLEKGGADVEFPEQILDLAKEGRVIPIENPMASGFSTEYVKLLKRLDVKSTIVAPILAGGNLLGLLLTDHCATPHRWQESEIDFLRQLASQLGLIIDRVNLLNQTEKQAKEQRQLKEELQRRALELLQEVDPISKGDLTIRAKVTADEIGTIADSYNATVGSLRQLVAQVKTAAITMADTTSNNETSVRGLSEEASRQAADISDALVQLEQMTEAIRQVALSAEQAESAAQQASQTVQAGDLAMNQTVDGIQAIRETVAETAKKVKHLGESSQKISTVVELISAFAAQTNMLALNASIEASRAGEEGRGFAVVAEEVRGLARKSAEATEEIRKLVSNIQVETNEVVAAMESGTEKVVSGTKLVDTTRQNLNQITAVSSQISRLVEKISQSTVVQSESAETITRRMKDVAAIANKTSVEANDVSTSFEELGRVAQTLQEGVGQFKVD